MGDGVNLSSRLEELNKRYDTSILISDSCAYHDAVREWFFLRPIDFVAVKGRKGGILLYECKSLERSMPLLSDQVLPKIIKPAAKEAVEDDEMVDAAVAPKLPDPYVGDGGSDDVDDKDLSAEKYADLICTQHNAAMQCYMHADFQRAITYLDCVLRLHALVDPDGKPDTCALQLRDRCTTMYVACFFLKL